MAFVDLGSDLIRKKWVREGLVQAKSKSFWTPYTGMTADSIVVQANNLNAKEGHTVVFDYDGNLSGKAIKGKDTAYGKGEKKKKFSDKITVDRYRLPVDNGDAFDGVDIGDLSITQHSDSRIKLADLFIRLKDQALFDAAQGANGQTPSHIIDLASTFDYDTVIDLEKYIKTATGFTTGGSTARTPLYPFTFSNGKPMWLFVVDTFMAAILKKSDNYQTMVISADVRGNENRALHGVIGKIGSFLIVEADSFFGYTDHTATTINLHDTEIEISGLRRKDSGGNWTGQTNFDTTLALDSRGFIMGKNALQIAFGKMPDYKFQESTDFGITSESALEVWMNVQKTTLLAEKEDYRAAKLAGFDFGIIAVDLETDAAD